jgi:hypothetical protein
MGGTLDARSIPGDTSFTLRLPAASSEHPRGRFHGKTDSRTDIETRVV